MPGKQDYLDRFWKAMGIRQPTMSEVAAMRAAREKLEIIRILHRLVHGDNSIVANMLKTFDEDPIYISKRKELNKDAMSLGISIGEVDKIVLKELIDETEKVVFKLYEMYGHDFAQKMAEAFYRLITMNFSKSFRDYSYDGEKWTRSGLLLPNEMEIGIAVKEAFGKKLEIEKSFGYKIPDMHYSEPDMEIKSIIDRLIYENNSIFDKMLETFHNDSTWQSKREKLKESTISLDIHSGHVDKIVLEELIKEISKNVFICYEDRGHDFAQRVSQAFYRVCRMVSKSLMHFYDDHDINHEVWITKISKPTSEEISRAVEETRVEKRNVQLNVSKNIQDQRNIVHEKLLSVPVLSEKWDVEQLASKKAPVIHAAEHGNRLNAFRESEFFNGFIRLRLSVSNKMPHTVTDVLLDIDLDENILRLDHYEPDTYAIRKGKIYLGNITPNNDKTIAVYLDPLTCSKDGTDVNCSIDYKDAYGRLDSIRIEPLKIPFTCPIFDTEKDINIGRLKELVASLPAHGSKVFSLSKGVEIGEAIALCREVIQMYDVRHVRTFKTTDGKTIETWYYGKTKVEKIDLVIKASVNKETGIEVFVAAPDQKVLTGLLAELGRIIAEKGKSLGKFTPQLNLTVKDSVVKGKRLLDFCDYNGICGANVVIEDSVLY